MATVVVNKKGKRVVLLNPAERAKRYASELKSGKKKSGKRLTAAEAGLRMGVLKERSTQAKIWKKKQVKKRAQANVKRNATRTKKK